MFVDNLILQIFLFQLGLPLLLIVLHAATPSASSIGLFLRFAAIGLALVLLALAGLWLFLPWWTPLILGVLLGIATLIASRRGSRSAKPPSRWRMLAEIAVSVAAIAALGTMLQPVIAGRQAPGDTVDLASPLEPGRYLVANGGTTTAINAHLIPLPPERAPDYRGQNYAVDIIGIDSFGFPASGIAPEAPERYSIYGRRILAPCDGAVVRAFDGAPDMPVPEMDREHMAGNYVHIACGPWVVVLAHMAPGSVEVSAGDRVIVGEQIGRVGNSGNTNGPHLHLHVQRGSPEAAPLSGDPLWLTIDGQFPVRNDRITISE